MRRRVLLSILLVIAATVLTLGVPLSVISWRVVDDLVHRDLQTRLESVAVSIANQSASSGLDLGQLATAVPPGGRLDIRMAGRIDQSIGPPISGETTSAQLVMAGGGLLRLAVPQDYLRTEQWTALALVALAVVLSVIVGTGVALLLAGRIVTPLSDLARRSARLGAGDFRTFRRRYGIGELDRVADVLDTSAQDIAALIGRERDLAGDISHQLRTRLTGLRLSLEELADHPDPLVAEEIQEALDQTDRLVTVVDDLLANARAERAAGASEVELADELAEIDTEWEPRLVEAGRSLLVRCPRNVLVRATPGRLREALAVLVENSLRHGAGPVEIGVRTVGGRSGDMVVVEVGDQGPGVPDALVPHVFDRGVSTASSSGIGLGLARAFVEADGGRLELRRAAPPVFAIFLRRAGEPAEGASSAAQTAGGRSDVPGS
ncbi:HAMP domain-containing histidine kinase [Nakamurella flava]|uniref:Signal transduction histidine-protein kinase/phosphatase MprB n=1 Tax=Nakamurella flava TaxID=2576308 RepID=A0A4U6QFB6_9ACTN|nr:ATP-binding protein [Nakamurella flava]TKV58883.1 HAMP domain-containing histidine kinase [Nakamurella flava]